MTLGMHTMWPRTHKSGKRRGSWCSSVRQDSSIGRRRASRRHSPPRRNFSGALAETQTHSRIPKWEILLQFLDGRRVNDRVSDRGLRTSSPRRRDPEGQKRADSATTFAIQGRSVGLVPRTAGVGMGPFTAFHLGFRRFSDVSARKLLRRTVLPGRFSHNEGPPGPNTERPLGR